MRVVLFLYADIAISLRYGNYIERSRMRSNDRTRYNLYVLAELLLGTCIYIRIMMLYNPIAAEHVVSNNSRIVRTRFISRHTHTLVHKHIIIQSVWPPTVIRPDEMILMHSSDVGNSTVFFAMWFLAKTIFNIF